MLVVLLGASATYAQIPYAHARCRNGLDKGVTTLVKKVLLAQQQCHRLRSQGVLSASLDCNDPAQSPSIDNIERAAARLRRLVSRRCAAAGTPASLGYVNCPAPCGGLISDYESLGDCFVCNTKRRLNDALVAAYGTDAPVPLGAATAPCQAAIGTALRTNLSARMRDQQKCQLVDDRAPIGSDCRTLDFTGKQESAHDKARHALERCNDSLLLALDSCASTVDGEQACIEDLSALHADGLFVEIYRPGEPTPTPTATASTVPATASATATATSTDTATPSHTATNTPVATPTPTRTSSATRTRTATRTPTWSPIAPTSTATFTLVPTDTEVPTETPTLTPPPTATATSIPTATGTALPPVHIDVTPFPAQSTFPCLIFVHGKRTDPGTFTDWNQARAYWVDGSDDFIRAATKNFAASYYVVGYNGTQAYWDAQSAGELATEIVNATEGGADGGGNRCARTFAEGGTFWLVGHSMGGSLISFVLGNAHPSDPNYNLNGPYDVAAQRVSLAITSAGTHRGSQGADFVCGEGNPFCSFFAGFIQSCDSATFWLRSSDDVQVRVFAGAPAKTVWLTGGFAAIIGASSCITGEDDGLVQHASAYACDGSATANLNNQTICGNGAKQESSGFMNLDTAHENHDEERNDSHSDNRDAIPDGVWICNGVRCAPGSTVHENLSTAAFVGRLY
jgi:hypothetical protein